MAQTVSAADSNDLNVVELWLNKDTTRWTAGILAGLFAGISAQVVGGLISITHGYEFLFPAKLLASCCLGAGATNYHSGVGAIIVGFLLFEAWGALWGFVFSHFVRTNKFVGLLGMGLTWSAFTWVFNWNLVFQSFRPLHTAQVPPSAGGLVCLAFGLGMMSVAIFDGLIRSK